GGFLGYDETTYAAGAFRTVRHRGDNEDLTHARVGDEYLAPVQAIAAVATDGRRTRPARVRAGARLRQTETAEHPAGGEQGDIPSLLRLRPEIQDRRRAERGMRADRDRIARVDTGELLDHDQIAQIVEALAAVLRGYVHAEEAELGHLPDALPGKLTFFVELTGDGTDLGFGELPDLGPESLVFFVQIRIHVPNSFVGLSAGYNLRDR